MATRKKYDLPNTVDLMLSENYEERFKAEYYQVRARREKLVKMIGDFYADRLDFEPVCPISLLTQQAEAMSNYMLILETRAIIEKIKL